MNNITSYSIVNANGNEDRPNLHLEFQHFYDAKRFYDMLVTVRTNIDISNITAYDVVATAYKESTGKSHVELNDECIKELRSYTPDFNLMLVQNGFTGWGAEVIIKLIKKN